MKTSNTALAIPMILLLCLGIIALVTTRYAGNLRSAQAEAFNEGRLRQCTYTLGCDMKALKSELFDQQRKSKLGLTKP